MSTVYKRGAFWWFAFKGPTRREFKSSGIPATEPKAKALKLLRQIETALGAPLAESKTVEEYATLWTEMRVARGLWNAKRDLERMTRHVLPRIGHLELSEVRPLQIRELITSLKATLAPRTVISTYGLVRRLFADALAEERIDSTPCALKRGDLPRKADSVVGWRAQAIYERAEVEQLISDARIPLDRRIVYGLGFLAGLRQGEIAALRWASVEFDRKPLGRILVVSSYTRAWGKEKAPKTGRAREVPLHPTLAALLEQWASRGFAETFGKGPTPEDLVAPNRLGAHRTDNNFFKGLRLDLEMLGLRHRRFHDTRRTFISLARTDGANPAVLKAITHDQAGDIFDQYTTFDWKAFCAAVAVLNVTTVKRKVLKLRSGASSSVTRSVTIFEIGLATIRNNSRNNHGQEGTRSRLDGDFEGPQPVSSGTYPVGSAQNEAERSIDCHTLLQRLRAIADDYEKHRDEQRLRSDLIGLADDLNGGA